MSGDSQNKKKYSRFLLILLMAGAACGCGLNSEKNKQETEQANAGRKAEIQVISITGNELTYLELESETEEVPEGMGFTGSKPDGTDFSGEIPKGMDFTDIVSESQNIKTVYLLVGVKVHTDTGKATTFSILEAGDELEALFEEDESGEEVITEIWITGTK